MIELSQQQKLRLYSKRCILLLLATCLAVSLVSTHIVSAASHKLFLNPDKQPPVPIGTEFTVNIKSYPIPDVTPGGASGTLRYDSHRLRFVSASVANTDYTNMSASRVADGYVQFNCNSCTVRNQTATKQLFSVKFRAVNAGSPTVWFENSSINSSALGNENYTNGSFPVYDPSPPPSTPPKPSQTPKPSTPPVITKPSTTPTPTPSQAPEEEQPIQTTPDPTGLVDNVNIQPLYTSSSVSWLVNAGNPKSTFRYGESSATLSQSSTPTRKEDGTFSVAISNLTPGKRYYFSIDATGDGGKAGSYSGTIATTGYPVVLVVNENDASAKSAQATIGSRTYNITNGKTAISLAAGKYTGKITTATATKAIEFVVEAKTIPEDGNRPESQTFTYNLASSALQGGPGSGMSLLSFVGIMVVGLITLGFGFIGFMAYRRRQFENSAESSYHSSPTVIIEDGYDWQPKDAPSAPKSYSPPDEKRD